MKILDVPQSGSVAGQTSSRNRYGQYRRSRTVPVNPATAKQGEVRTRLGIISSLWRDLTAPQRLSWEDCALDYPILNSLGQSVVLSAHAMFVRANTARLNAGLAELAVPVVATTFSAAGITVTATAGTPTLSIVFSPPSSDQVIVVDAGPQVSSGINFGENYRFVLAIDDADVSPMALLSAYTAIWGPLVAGKKIFFRTRALNECGVYGAANYATVIVAA